MVLEKTLESPLDHKEIQPIHPKGDQSWVFIGRTDAESWNSSTLATWCKELTYLKRPWYWERLKGGDDRGWDGWMALPTQWTWVWVNSRSWQWTGRPGMLQPMRSQRVGHDWVTELNWRLLIPFHIVRICQRMGWGGKWEGVSGWGTHVHPWRIQVNVWQNQYNTVK